MALPFLLSLLGSTAAGAGALGGLSPLIAGALGAGVGSTIETGSLEEGIKTGLTAGLLGGIGGALTGGAGAAAPGATATATGEAAKQGFMANMPKGLEAVAAPPAGTSLGARLSQGFTQGAASGAGMGTALGAGMMTRPEMPEPRKYEYTPRHGSPRDRYTPPPGYVPGRDPEFNYFGQMPNYLAGGGYINVNVPRMGPVPMRAGGLASIRRMQQGGAMAQPNEKEIVQLAIRAIKNELPEQEAIMVLGQFLQTYGEDALRKLVDDVRSGRADGPRGDVEGTVRGPGDGMSDMVPARMDDGSQDVLLSDGEFVVPADVVSGLGNGSTDAGADELYKMMDRVRGERTGMTEQPAAVAAGGLLPV